MSMKAIVNSKSSLSIRVIRADGKVEDLGIVSGGTTTGHIKEENKEVK